jgi:hypothetical protein
MLDTLRSFSILPRNARPRKRPTDRNVLFSVSLYEKLCEALCNNPS